MNIQNYNFKHLLKPDYHFSAQIITNKTSNRSSILGNGAKGPDKPQISNIN